MAVVTYPPASGQLEPQDVAFIEGDLSEREFNEAFAALAARQHESHDQGSSGPHQHRKPCRELGPLYGTLRGVFRERPKISSSHSDDPECFGNSRYWRGLSCIIACGTIALGPADPILRGPLAGFVVDSMLAMPPPLGSKGRIIVRSLNRACSGDPVEEVTLWKNEANYSEVS
jgi:hypothetical protein